MAWKVRPPLYTTWQSIRTRCLNESHKQYANYGGRGITICSRWNNFSLFAEDMGPRPEGFTIERIDNNKGYSPDNCRWATYAEQRRNTRANRFVEIMGMRLCATDWAHYMKVDKSFVSKSLLKHGDIAIERMLKARGLMP